MRRLFGDRRIREHGDPSGLAVAERAHDRGKVAVLEQQAVCDVRIELAVRGTREHAEAVAGSLAYRLSLRPDVNRVTFSAAER